MGRRKALLGRVSDVDLRLLRIFQTVVNCGGFSAAEIDLGIGRSTISTHIGELEARLGTRLCQRGRGGFALTTRGKKIYEASLGLMKSLDDFRNEVNADQDTMTGEINIGVVDNIIWDKELRLRNVFRDFSEVASNIDLTLYVLSPDEIERRLIDERLHVGIAPVMHEVAGLVYTYLFDEINHLYCGKGHPLFDRPDSEITTADLIKSQYVKKGYAVSSNLQQANSAMGKRVVGFHVEAFALLILSGRYIGFLPEHYAAVWEGSGEMRRLLPKRYSAVVSFASMTARSRPHTKAADAFLACLHRPANGQENVDGVAARPRGDRGTIVGLEQGA
jgi:LysR family transcriptional regulator, transcriptional activator for bauABCD operon